ncbi:uncharacterized protein LOC143030713 isoform X1 [Oratosquilla oratoria]|uniref:uncharacterized protein LOC143030713 isoform X1 n=1 Tax=Oratosquilla oratoria TaxID=337810 RepID=UPI003F77678C
MGDPRPLRGSGDVAILLALGVAVVVVVTSLGPAHALSPDPDEGPPQAPPSEAPSGRSSGRPTSPTSGHPSEAPPSEALSGSTSGHPSEGLQVPDVLLLQAALLRGDQVEPMGKLSHAHSHPLTPTNSRPITHAHSLTPHSHPLNHVP